MPPKNQGCPCGSGLPYKYCHIGNDLRERLIFMDLDIENGVWALINMKYDLLNVASTVELPLKYFCKDNGFYFFGMGLTIGEAENLTELLKKNTLTKEIFFNVFINQCQEEPVMKILEQACKESELFKKREKLLTEGFKLHFENRYAASILVLLPQLEGLLRDYGKIPNRANFKPSIPEKIWEEQSLYAMEDDAKNYNAFIHKLFEGGKDENTFNRNPILHGFNINFESKEHSLLLILAIMEIRLFIWWSKHLNFKSDLKRFIMKYVHHKPLNHIGDHFKHMGVEIDVFRFS